MSTRQISIKTEDGGNSASHSQVIPDKMQALVLDGVGFEHIGVRSVRTPRPGPRQLLARVDAAGVCSSILKIIDQGSRHPMLFGWDVAKHPLILGDEGSITVVEIGEELRDRYALGERYAIQAAVDHHPINHPERYRDNGRGVERLGVGYTLPGHLAEYLLVTEEILEAQCLLPLRDRPLPYAHAALSEPLACIISAHDHHMHLVQETPLSPRTVLKGLKPGGVTVIIGAGTMGRMHIDLALSCRPRVIVSVDHHDERLEHVRNLFGARALKLGITLQTVNSTVTDLKEVISDLTDRRGADDVIVAAGSAKAIEAAQDVPARYAVMHLFASLRKGEDIIDLNTTTVHYKEINVTGSAGGTPWDVARALDLMAAGELDPGAHISRIGGLDHVVELLKLTKARLIEGKAVVYPHRRTSEIQSVRSWSAEDEKAYLARAES
jgi:L-sorbose 1-phosphate reductase